MATVDVLIPTLARKTGLAITLTSLLGQTFRDFDVIVADQTPEAEAYLDSIEVRSLLDALRWHGRRVETHRRPQRRGMAEQREFLLGRARAPYVHFLDDDVLLDPPVMERMVRVIRQDRCGFVGCAAAGLSFLDDVRPQEQAVELWEGPVRAEPVDPEAPPWTRHLANRAANPLHLERRLIRGGEVLRYKVCWIGGANVLYDRAKLLQVGGFSFWRELPPEHAGEEVLAQLLLLHAHGGCGLLPCGTYHLCLPTKVPDRRRNAVELLGRRLAELGAATGTPEASRPQ